MNTKRGMKLGLLTLFLMLVIGVGIYISKESSGEILPDEMQSENSEQAQTNAYDPFKALYFKEISKESLLEESKGNRIFYRYKNEWLKAVPAGKKVGFESMSSGKTIFEISKDLFDAPAFDLSPDGFLWTANYSLDKNSLEVQKYNLKGKRLETIDIKDLGSLSVDQDNFIKEMRVQAGHIYFLAKADPFSQLRVYDESGKLKYSHDNAKSFDVHETGDFVVQKLDSPDFNFMGFFGYRISDGSEYMRNERLFPKLIRYNIDYSQLFLVNEEITFVDPKTGRMIRPLLEFGIDSSFLIDDIDLVDFLATQDNQLRVLVSKKNDEKLTNVADSCLYTFKKVDGVKEKRKVTLKLTVPYRSDFISEAIKRYELYHPEEHIEYDYAYQNYEDFVKNSIEYGEKLVLQIIGNEVGDIVQVGGSMVKYWSLAQTDVFTDLEPLLKAEPLYKDLNASVLEGIRINGHIRALPITVHFYQNEIDATLAESLGIQNLDDVTWSEALSWIDLLEKKGGPYKWINKMSAKQATINSVLNAMLIANMPDLIDIEKKTVNLNQEWFKDLMKKFKSVSRSEYLALEGGKDDFFDNLQGALMRSWMPGFTLQDELTYHVEYNKEHRSLYIPCFSGEVNPNRIAYSKYMYSINERSERKESAMKFLMFLLSEEMQTKIHFEGIPVNNKAMDLMIESAIFKKEFSEDDLTPAGNQYIEALRTNSQKVDFMYDMDYMKFDISEEIQRYLNDEISLEEALENAENKVIIRLNE